MNNIVDAGEIHIAIYDSKDAFEQDRGEQGRPAPGIVDGEAVPLGKVFLIRLTFHQATTL